MPAVVVAAPTLTAATDYAVYLLRFPLIFLGAIIFSVSFGVYMIDAMGAWPRKGKGVLHANRRRHRKHVNGNGRMRSEIA
ncbi:hypothetical protein K440DRAFT_614539 [Wilcoxina mikolae CBS 423.85]|nr:hypothetical protein K440DRAFT_614539 [Wilcoxina mikolae CBS 423.85]